MMPQELGQSVPYMPLNINAGGTKIAFAHKKSRELTFTVPLKAEMGVEVF